MSRRQGLARLAGLVCVLVVGALAASAAPAQAAFPGKRGFLVYVEETLSGGGTAHFVQAITYRLSAPGYFCDDLESLCPVSTPTFSPSGRRLAASVGVNVGSGPCGGCAPPKAWRLATASTSFSGLASLPPLTNADRQPAWSPDGRRLVFSGSEHRRRHLYVVKADGSGLRRLTGARAGDVEPTWSVGGVIAFRRGSSLFTIRPDGSGLRRLTRGGRRPDWSPDGRSVAFDRRGQIYRIRATRGSRPKRLTRRGGIIATWSPDGRGIAFRRRFDVYLMNAAGRRPRRILKWLHMDDHCQKDPCAPRDFDWQPRR